MTGFVSTALPDADRDRVRRALLPLAVVTFAVAATWTVLGAHHTREAAVVVAVLAAATAVVFGPVTVGALRRPASSGTALALSAAAGVLTVPAYWSGVPLVLGVAGLTLGYVGRNAASGAGRSVAAIVLGALAVIGYLAIYVVDGLVYGNL